MHQTGIYSWLRSGKHMNRQTRLVKTQTYLQNVEKPVLVKFYKKLSPDLNWQKLANCLSTPMSDRNDDFDQQLRELYDDGTLPSLRATHMSEMQSTRSLAGKELEVKVAKTLQEANISYGSQVTVIDSIIEKGPRKGKKRYVVDFVVPKPTIGTPLNDYTIISCKTTLRERISQDAHLDCKQLIVVTHDAIMESKIVEDNDRSIYVYVPRSDDAEKESSYFAKLTQLLEAFVML